MSATMQEAFAKAAEKLMEQREEPKYPDIIFDTHGNSYERLTLVMDVLDELTLAGIGEEEREQYRKQALSGDYETAIVVTGNWVTLR